MTDLLNIKVRLDNGEEGFVLAKTVDDFNKPRYRCNVCDVPISSGKGLFEHVAGKNHTRKMKAAFHPHESFPKSTKIGSGLYFLIDLPVFYIISGFLILV